MHEIDPKRFAVGTEFRHDKGGCWRIAALNNDVLTLTPIGNTMLKPNDQLIARSFKIFGVWFKIEASGGGKIVLRQKVQPHEPAV